MQKKMIICKSDWSINYSDSAINNADNVILTISVWDLSYYGSHAADTVATD
jgi:hypothetical protein